VLALPQAFAAATTTTKIDKIILFGDSLSDNGNLFDISSKAHNVIPLIPVVPKTPPYFAGRFTNGQVWVEHLATALNVQLEDYAYGGAWIESAYDSHHLVPLDLDSQISLYRVHAAFDQDKKNHLYVVWAGANDYVHDRANMEEATTRTVNILKSHLDLLIYLGAQHFFVPTIPNLALVPEVREKGQDYMKRQEMMSKLHNQKLLAMIIQEQAEHPTLQFTVMDVSAVLEEVVKDPAKYNIKETRSACYTGSYSLRKQKLYHNMVELNAARQYDLDLINNPQLHAAYVTGLLADNGVAPCANPDEYLFWDQIHPTRVIHAVMAKLAEVNLHENGYEGQHAAY
jgi:phospholipase/lecithinase/hemolysin